MTGLAGQNVIHRCRDRHREPKPNVVASKIQGGSSTGTADILGAKKARHLGGADGLSDQTLHAADFNIEWSYCGSMELIEPAEATEK
ncbi:hypothetical protein [Arthrobacter sp. ZGTC412]|uniref:hypothetical protein n=1 Tax=Arthrobacter sp. ZGTC412 TaxID=2058900 RepID=UPI000CE2D1E8|nr:hypothetical protein [Arthrobacter sp. ZGTC412]